MKETVYETFSAAEIILPELPGSSAGMPQPALSQSVLPGTAIQGSAAQMEKVPYLLVLGKNEAADGTVSYRLHGEQNSTTVSREDFLALLKEDIRTKKINPAALK